MTSNDALKTIFQREASMERKMCAHSESVAHMNVISRITTTTKICREWTALPWISALMLN